MISNNFLPEYISDDPLFSKWLIPCDLLEDITYTNKKTFTYFIFVTSASVLHISV
jgi:hypothetical protein